MRAAEVIGALTNRPDSPAAARETEVEVLATLGFLQTGVSDPKAIATLEKAVQQAIGLGARDVKDTYVSGLYTDAGAWLVVAHLTQGNYDEARSIAEDASNVADGILTLNPGDRTALYALALMQQSLGDASTSELRPQEAIPSYLRAATVQQTLVDFDPKNTVAQNNLASVQWSTAEAYWAMGEVDDALEMLDATRATSRISGEAGTWSRLAQFRFLSHIAWRTADAGDFGKSRDIIEEMESYLPALKKSEPAGSLAVPFAELLTLRAESRLALARGDASAARDIGADMDARLQAMRPEGETDIQWKDASTYFANDVKSQAEIALKDFEAAERSARVALAAKERWIFDPSTRHSPEGRGLDDHRAGARGPGQNCRGPASHRAGREAAPRPGEPQSRRPEPESRDGGCALRAGAQRSRAPRGASARVAGPAREPPGPGEIAGVDPHLGSSRRRLGVFGPAGKT